MQAIVIQGPTTFYKDVISSYTNLPENIVVVWSTWKDEPEENLKEINDKMHLVVAEKPQFSGYLNINMQLGSTFCGLDFIKQNFSQVTEVLKVRGDIKINNTRRLMNILQGNKLSFLQMCKPGVRKDGIPTYFLEYEHDSHDYPTDNIMYGDMLLFHRAFNYLTKDFLTVPPEVIIAYRIIKSYGIPFKFDFKHLIDNNVSFFLQGCLDNDIDIFLVKDKYNRSIIELTKDREYYEY